jgi:hypothetical protein
MSTHLILRLATLIVCLIGVTSTQVAAGPLDLLTINRVEADPEKSYRLSEKHGPWMIMACSFSGEGANEQARELVLELRSRYKLPAYTYMKEFDFTEGTVGRGVDPYGAPLRMRNKRGDGTVECAVLVGEFPTVDDKKAQTTLKRLKYYHPECLELDENRRTSRSLAALRVIQQNLLKPGNEKKDRGAMGHAFIIPNPLLPKDYFVSSGVDQFTVRLNKDNKYNLLKCPGKYTVQVAHFTGKVTINQKEIQEIEKGRKKVSNRLDKAGENAETLCRALREKGYEAYLLHERYASIVTVGSFNSVGTPRNDGRIEMSPDILAIIERFKATKAPEVLANGRNPLSLQPKSLVGIPFDLQPIVVHAPKRSIGDDYTSSSNPIRSLW